MAERLAPAGNDAGTKNAGHTFALSSSLRTRTAQASLALVKPIAFDRGISRVADTTWLDRVGIPVYAAIRPDAVKGSLNVHAGKGLTHDEAKIGAYMEAIEYSFAEPGRSRVRWRMATPIDILDSFDHQIRFTDFCPTSHATVRASDALAVVEGEEIFGLGRSVLVPAELVYFPFPGCPGVELYGTTTNGLASGNSVADATVHAIAEVMERHVDSFLKVGTPSYWVEPASLPPKLSGTVRQFEQAGLQFHLRYSPNEFGLPHFCAYAMEDGKAPVALVQGVGFHCNSDVAAVRAISEAAQSRLTTIHGGRDDLVDIHFIFDRLGQEHELALKDRLRMAIVERSRRVAFDEIPDACARSVADAHAALLQGLERAGLNHVVRVVYTEPDYPFQVVRIIVPGAEHYDYHLRRVGTRLLRHFVEQQARAGTEAQQS